jgi:peptidoglycan/xylan/chitin deacetylase (PgdA/CDA1 family)
MQADWSAIKARVSNRLARHLYATPLVLSGHDPMVSFTFDDIPDTAASIAAPMIEEYGADADDIIGLHGKGHEIACHTFTHRRTTDLDADTMAEEIELNRRFLEGLDSSIRLDNFAHPYGSVSVSRKGQLAGTFRSARSILPGVNSGSIDLHFLRATPLVNEHIDADGIDRVFDETVETGGWLIFYGHDIATKPSPYGCTPQLLRHALQAAAKRKLPILTVAEALRRVEA